MGKITHPIVATEEQEIVRDALRDELQLIGAEVHSVQLTRLTSGRVVISIEVPVPIAQKITEKIGAATFTPLEGMALYSRHTESVGEMVRWHGPQAVILRDLRTGKEDMHWLSGLRPALLEEMPR